MFKRGTKSWLIWTIILAALFIGFGIVNLVFNDNRDYQSVLILILGILVIIDASIRLLLNIFTVARLSEANVIADTRRHAVYASFELALGISLISLSNLIKSYELGQVEFLFRFIGTFLGITALVMAGLTLLYAIILIVRSNTQASKIVGMILGVAILVTVGVLALVYLRDQNVIRVFFIYFGVAFLVTGVCLLFAAIAFFALARKQQSILKQRVVEQAQEQAQEEPKQEENKAE